jgi:hypothetical protein
MRTTIILLTIFFCISCNSNKNSLPTVIDLDNVENVKLSEIVDSIKMVQLETTPECLMQSATEIFIYNDRFYIFDGEQYVVFCFDKEGKFYLKLITEAGDLKSIQIYVILNLTKLTIGSCFLNLGVIFSILHYRANLYQNLSYLMR